MQRVPRPKGPNDAQLTFNLPGEWVDELDRLAEKMSRPGISVTRTDVLRLAVRTGIDHLSAEHPSSKAAEHPGKGAKRR